MAQLNWTMNVGNNVVIKYLITDAAPTKPTAENYRFDVSYNETLTGNSDFTNVVIEFYDEDKGSWSPLAGTMVDGAIYMEIVKSAKFKNCEYVYYTLSKDELNETNIIDVTPH